MTEKEKFLNWLNQELKKGLVDIHVEITKPIENEEDFFKSLNEFYTALANGNTVKDDDIF